MNFNFGPEWAETIQIVFVAFFVLTAIIHIMFAIGVFHSASKLVRNRVLHFVPEVVWMIATLFGGVFVATAFWAIHHSNLNPEVSRTERDH